MVLLSNPSFLHITMTGDKIWGLWSSHTLLSSSVTHFQSNLISVD